MSKNRVIVMNAMPSKNKFSPGRKGFLSLISNSLLYISGLLGLTGIARYLSYEDSVVAVRRYDLGAADVYPVGSQTIIPQAQAVLLHTPEGFQAISLLCTHLGCLVSSDIDGFACPCHGSRFDSQGNVIHGPARVPLTRLLVEEQPNGSLVLYRN